MLMVGRVLIVWMLWTGAWSSVRFEVEVFWLWIKAMQRRYDWFAYYYYWIFLQFLHDWNRSSNLNLVTYSIRGFQVIGHFDFSLIFRGNLIRKLFHGWFYRIFNPVGKLLQGTLPLHLLLFLLESLAFSSRF
jgi:hypothetical protein